MVDKDEKTMYRWRKRWWDIMEKFARKWKMYRWFLMIPLLITATLIYMFTGASGAA